jgi:hypothetical protein
MSNFVMNASLIVQGISQEMLEETIEPLDMFYSNYIKTNN